MPPRKQKSTRAKRAASPVDPGESSAKKKARAEAAPDMVDVGQPENPPSAPVEAKPGPSKSHSKPYPKMHAARPPSPEYGEEEIEEPAAKTAPKKVRLCLGEAGSSVIVEPTAEIDELVDDHDILLPIDLDTDSEPEEELPKPKTPKIAFVTQQDGILTRPIAIPDDVDFDVFRYRVADEFRVAANAQELVWKTNWMAKSANWATLRDAEDFRRVMDQARATIVAEAERRCLLIAQNAAGMKKSNAKGKSFVPKLIPAIEEFVIMIRDCNQERKAKEQAPKKDKKPEKTEGAGPLKGIAGRILENEAKIKARNCEKCGKSCVIVPTRGGAPEHKELSRADIQLWAQIAAKGTDISLETPPQQLILQLSDRPPEKRGKVKSEASGSSDQNSNPPAPISAAPGPMQPYIPPLAAPHMPYQPHPMYYPPPMPPPTPYGYYNSYNYGYPPPPMPGPHFMNTGHGPGRSNMLLSEWLPMCDRGERGANGDNFASLVAGFSAQRILCLSDLRNKSEHFFTNEIEFPTTPGGPTFHMAHGTAIRLVQYVAADLGHY
ncbi:hypothetical protein CTheo_5589 [Ceratobasidium theobromae]|uniref:Uncharacterized protein n=1 Tax=Ceratobasidium theobromae TaxID=1582974 RepID=A0A5N5QHG1_9AGAM|nr:hypothetical protein CTheo_5589 [Ceratobasidium theobromae]